LGPQKNERKLSTSSLIECCWKKSFYPAGRDQLKGIIGKRLVFYLSVMISKLVSKRRHSIFWFSVKPTFAP
jgi:hypothetical protein